MMREVQSLAQPVDLIIMIINVRVVSESHTVSMQFHEEHVVKCSEYELRFLSVPEN